MHTTQDMNDCKLRKYEQKLDKNPALRNGVYVFAVPSSDQVNDKSKVEHYYN